MTTDCIETPTPAFSERTLHDALVGLAVTVIVIIPATLALFTLL